MNSKVLSVAAGLAMFTAFAASAVPSTVTQNSTQNVTKTGTTFTFNTFDSTLGTLTAVNLLIQSSNLSGNLSVVRGSGTGTVTINSINSFLILSGDIGSGLNGDDAFSSSPLAFNRTPSGSFNLTSGNNTRVVTIDGTQSLISPSTAVGFGGGFDLNYYVGDGSSTFSYSANLDFGLGQNSSGSATASIPSASALAATQLTLQYTYTTDPAPIPEPGQVAASILLLSGIGAYVFIKRRKKSARAAA